MYPDQNRTTRIQRRSEMMPKALKDGNCPYIRPLQGPCRKSGVRLATTLTSFLNPQPAPTISAVCRHSEKSSSKHEAMSAPELVEGKPTKKTRQRVIVSCTECNRRKQKARDYLHVSRFWAKLTYGSAIECGPVIVV